MGYWTTMA